MFATKMTAVLGAGLLLTGLAAVQASERPPKDGKPLSEIVASLEAANEGVVTAVEFDDGRWEAEVHRDGRETDLSIDARTGQVTRRTADNDRREELPPRGSRPLSAIVRSLEQQEPGVVTEVEFDDGFWEVEIQADGREVKLDINPQTGQPRS
jgi:uncharacterized membrane protein YkoI